MAHEYAVQFRYDHRKLGSEGRTIRVQGTSQAAAIGKATRQFWKGLSRKERFDAGKELRITCRRVEPLTDAPPEVYAMRNQAIGGQQ